MKKVHYLSGLTITLFVGFHLFNHLMSVFGAEVHIEIMNVMRKVYRNFMVETILLTAVLVQIISGLKLFFTKRKLVSNFFDRLQVWTGLYLAFFLLIHVGAVLMGRFVLHLDTNFYFGVAGLNTFPLNFFFIPYYGLAVISFFGHIAAIHYQKMQASVLELSVQKQSKLILGIGFVLTAILFFGLTNGFRGVEIPDEYLIMTGK